MLHQADQRIRLRIPQQIKNIFICSWYFEWLKIQPFVNGINKTVCNPRKFTGMSRCVFLESKKWITGMCLLILRVYSERILIENGKRLEYNTTKHVTALSKIECVSYCVHSPVCCSVSYNDVSSQCVLDQSCCCDVETTVEHNTMLIENGYMDFILANHTAGKLTLFYFYKPRKDTSRQRH